MTGGGAATNSGIDFQHRVGGLAMLAMLTDVNMLGGEIGEHRISEARFETADGVDDIVLITNGPRVYVQAKRSISLSSSRESEYSSTLKQFVNQYLRSPDSDDVYVLATSTTASTRIRHDLRKLTEAARFNELGLDKNPLSQTERNTLETTLELIEYHFQNFANMIPTGHERTEILRRIHVAIFDIERGGSLEQALLTVLASHAGVAPMLVWNSLISLALSFAKDRLSIDRTALQSRMGKYFVRDKSSSSANDESEALRIIVDDSGFASDREVVLATYEGRLLLMELIRFAEDGSRRVRFADGLIEMTNGEKWPVIRRTSTMAGMTRLIEADVSILEGRELVIAPIKSDEDYDASTWAQAHADVCQQLWHENTAPFQCLACGRPVSDSNAQVVEVDEDGSPHEVGLVHSRCLRPTHRVTGGVASELFKTYPELIDFDYNTWFNTRPTGQGIFNAIGATPQAKLIPILWKPGRDYLSVGTWGISYTLEDGSQRFVRERGRVHRFSRSGAYDACQSMNENIANSLAKEDPVCISVDTDSYGNYSALLRSGGGVRLLKVVSAEARELDRATIIAHKTVDNYYAPLIAPIDFDQNEPFAILGSLVLLTDPLMISDMILNWKRAGIAVPTLATSIIRSDDQFDSFLAGALIDNMGVLIDPVLDPTGQLVSGAVVEILAAVIESRRHPGEG